MFTLEIIKITETSLNALKSSNIRALSVFILILMMSKARCLTTVEECFFKAVKKGEDVIFLYNEFTEAINKVFGTDIYYEYINNESYEAIQKKNLGKQLGTMIASVYQSIQLGHFNLDSDFEEIVGREHKTIVQILEDFKNN